VKETRNAYKTFNLKKAEMKKPLRALNNRSKQSLKTDIKEMGCDGYRLYLSGSGQDLGNTAIKHWVS
jgi:hypothetical protein